MTGAGKTATVATDGSTVAVWSGKRLGRYKDFQSGPGADGFHVFEWRARWMSGAAFPCPRVPEKAKGLARVMVAGWPAYLPWAMVAQLAQWDACLLGSARPAEGEDRSEVTGWREWVSLRLSFGDDLFHGVLRCSPQPGAKP